jgi:hypothetical protein
MELEKKWLQLLFCIKEEEVEMMMRDWQYDWQIPIITKNMPKGKEVEAGSSKTPVGGSAATKKPMEQVKPGQKLAQQKKGSAPKKDART